MPCCGTLRGFSEIGFSAFNRFSYVIECFFLKFRDLFSRNHVPTGHLKAGNILMEIEGTKVMRGAARGRMWRRSRIVLYLDTKTVE
jgi:hypothetical protein